MSDQYLFETSTESQYETEPFVLKKVLYQQDQNNSAYNGQVLLDTSSLSNSGMYCSYADANFEVPIVVRLTANTAACSGDAQYQALQSAFAVGLKNGYYQFIHSMSVELNNTSVCQLVPYLNHYVNYKMMSQFSLDDVEKYGTLLGFYPDNVTSFDYGSQNAVDVSGHGVLNNRNLPQFPADVYTYGDAINTEHNCGFFKRQKYTTAPNPATTPLSYFTNTANYTVVGNNYFMVGTGTNTASKFWFVLATIRLKDISDFFAKIPLSKGLYLRFIINYNQPTHTIAVTTNGGAITDIASTSNVITGGSSPLMLANGGVAGNGFYSIANRCAAIGDATYSFTLTSSVAKYTTANISHPTLSNVRLYVPSFQMAPQIEEEYLSLNRVKTIEYTDIMNYSVNVSLSNGVGSVSSLLTNGLINPQQIIIIPYIGSASNYTANGSAAIQPYSSPFTSEPGLPSPGIQLSNFNILVSGVNVFTQSEIYSFSQFIDELSSAECLNGGKSTGLTSGLWTYEKFQQTPIYVVDLSRRIAAEDSIPKSIQVQSNVYSAFDNVQLQIFVSYTKKIVIDVSSGQLLG